MQLSRLRRKPGLDLEAKAKAICKGHKIWPRGQRELHRCTSQLLKKFFTSVFVKEDGDQNSSHKEVNVNGLDVNINKDIVLDKLLQLKEDKAQGPDEIHPAVLKNCAHNIAWPLSIIYRKSLAEGGW